jgi:starvation-inducible DNA-binding protein
MRSNHNNGHNPKQQVSIQPNIGLDRDTRQLIMKMLDQTVADETVLMLKTRNAHWNVSGADFFELHILFDTQFKQINEITDEIAERIRILGGFAIGGLKEILAHARLVERPGKVPDILHLLADHEAMIRFLREDTQKCSEEYEDEGTSDLLVSIMRLHEKMAWILRSYTETDLLNTKNQGGLLSPPDTFRSDHPTEKG